MSFLRWWFPGAIVVALLLGLVFGFATATNTDADDTATPTSVADATTTSEVTSSDSTDTTDDTTGDTTASTTDSTDAAAPTTEAPTTTVPVDIATLVDTEPGWLLRTQSSRELPSLLPVPEQTALVIADLDGNGVDDIVVAGRGGPNAIQWLQRGDGGWTTRSIEPGEISIEAGGTSHDIDGDGDLDLIFGGDFSSSEVWWWENPSPDFGDPWIRRTIKTDGGPMHHDMLMADLDGDGADELVFWNQRADVPTLWAATVPADPSDGAPWERRAIWQAEGTREGLAARDMNDDGDVDLVAGGNLLLNDGIGNFQAVPVAEDLAGGRAEIAQLVAGGAPELIFDSGDSTGPLAWFQWNGEVWQRNVLLEASRHGHSLDVADADGDGDVDILSAEMHLEAGDDARARVFLNDGDGTFTVEQLSVGMDNHESKFADVDGDGDADVVTKPFNWFTPRLDIWERTPVPSLAAGWERVVVDDGRPDQAIFVIPADVDGDGDFDLASGPNVLINPGDPRDDWFVQPVGQSFNQAILAEDLDGDGDIDLVGTQGVGSSPNANLIWARNDGDSLVVFDNVEPGTGDFPQGAAIGRFAPAGPLLVLVSWHEAGNGLQSFQVIDGDPSANVWGFGLVTDFSQDEEIQLGDIDGDTDLDVMMGNAWLRNDTTSGEVFTLHTPTSGTPDRNRLVDMDGDGDLDVVVSYEDAVNGRVAWYEQGDDPAQLWTEHLIGTLTMGLSLDVGDIDGDGDIDVVVGEHSTSDTAAMSLLLFENTGDNLTFAQGEIYVGDEHHDGAQLVDLDRDGDLDVVTIGWTHGRTVAYLNPAV